MKKAYLLDDDVILRGVLFHRFWISLFIPESKECGFDHQRIWRADIGTKLFFSEGAIEKAGLGHLRITGEESKTPAGRSDRRS
jgi:hypothetical protein